MGFRADSLLAIRIENNDVRVGPNRDRPFPRKYSKDLGSRSGSEFDKSIQANPFLNDAAVVDEAHPMLNAWAAIRNFAEVVTAEFFLLLEAERAMVGGYDLKIIST